MKKVLTVLAAALAISMPALAATTQTVTASASVDQVLDLTIATYKLDANGVPTGANLGSSIPFGALVRDTANGVMRGADAYTVYLGANSSSRPYNIKATMPALTNGTTTLPHAMVCTVVSAKNGATTVGTFPSGGQDAVMTNSVIYTSSVTGQSASIQLVYGISGGNAVGQPLPHASWAPILLDQASGTFTASATYTIALT